MEYEKQSNILQEIETYSKEELSSSSKFLTPDQYPNFWKELLIAIQELSGKNSDVIKQGDIIDESLLSYIESNCDLPLDNYDKTNETTIDENGKIRPILLSEFYNQIKRETKDKKASFFWNESLEAAVRHFLKFFTFKDDQVLIKIPSDTGAHSITVGTIREADAGYSFTPSEWVRPFWNINNKNYNEVRGHDQVNDILKNEDKLQYTRKIDETYKWIRLLMPQYGRRVETEDLNRNWWVIAQVIAAISDFLFDDDSPIENMFDYFLRELTELWENMLYLWLEVAMASQKTNDGVRVIVLPLQADENRTDKRFDNFNDIISYSDVSCSGGGWIFTGLKIYGKTDKEEQKNEIFNHIKYLAEEYSEQNLCIIPYLRMENYKHNYYVGEYYPYVFIYNQKEGEYDNINKWNIYSIKYYNNELVISPKPEYEYIKFSENICSFKYNKGEETYSYQYPFSQLGDTEPFTGDNQTLMYAGLRTEVNIDFDFSPTDIIINEMKIDVYDAIRKGIDKETKPIGNFHCSNIDNNNTMHFTFENTNNYTEPNIKGIQKKDCFDIVHAAYLGECATYWGKSMINYTADLTQISIACANKESDAWTVKYDIIFDKFSDFLADINNGLKTVKGEETTDSSKLYKFWQEKVQSTVIPINSAKFLYSHIVYREIDDAGDRSSYLECSPFISYIINDGGHYYYYHYIFEINESQNPEMKIKNLGKIAYPYTSSRYETGDKVIKDYNVQYSTQLLCQYPWSGNYKDINDNTVSPTSPTQEISKGFKVYAPNTQHISPAEDNPDPFLPDWIDLDIDAHTTAKRQGSPCGNLVYNKHSLKIKANGKAVQMSDFIICAQDRACAGASQISDIFPYYYCCTITQIAASEQWGIIQAKIYLNNKSDALDTEDGIYVWSSDTHPFLQSYSKTNNYGGDGRLGIKDFAYQEQYKNISESVFNKERYTTIHTHNIEAI